MGEKSCVTDLNLVCLSLQPALTSSRLWKNIRANLLFKSNIFGILLGILCYFMQDIKYQGIAISKTNFKAMISYFSLVKIFGNEKQETDMHKRTQIMHFLANNRICSIGILSRSNTQAYFKHFQSSLEVLKLHTLPFSDLNSC